MKAIINKDTNIIDQETHKYLDNITNQSLRIVKNSLFNIHVNKSESCQNNVRINDQINLIAQTIHSTIFVISSIKSISD